MSSRDTLADSSLVLKIVARKEVSGHLLKLFFRCGGKAPADEFSKLPVPETIKGRIKEALAAGVHKERGLREAFTPGGQDVWSFRWALVRHRKASVAESDVVAADVAAVGKIPDAVPPPVAKTAKKHLADGRSITGEAPKLFARWLAAHQHKDVKNGFVYLYHSRSDAHSKELCRLIAEDLLTASPTLKKHAERGTIVYGINCLYSFPVDNKVKTLDFVIAKGQPDLAAQKIGGVLSPAKVIGTLQMKNRKVPQLAIERVLISCESKAVMTEHSKSQPRIFDELSSSHQIVHKGDPDAIAAGITVVNSAGTFVSPLRQKKGQALVVTQHKQPRAAQRMVEHLRGLPIRLIGDTSPGFDAYATVVIDCDNQNVAKLVTAAPAPQPSERDHYDTFLSALVLAYEDRFGGEDT